MTGVSPIAAAMAAHPQLFRRGYVTRPTRTFEAHRLEVHQSRYDGRLRLAGAELNNQCGAIDISWLKSASMAYDISADPRDYVIVELPIVTADIPNRNMDAFPYEELTSFNTLVGRVVYQTLIGKPTFQDHDNQNPKKAKGVIFDAVFRKYGDQVWKVRELAGFDRGKDPKLAQAILRKLRDKYSMGALASYVACSVCAKTYDGAIANACYHIAQIGKGNLDEDRLIYDQCFGVNFCETSSVEDPADITAWSDSLLQS